MSILNKKPKYDVPQVQPPASHVEVPSGQPDSAKTQELEDAIIQLNDKLEKKFQDMGVYVNGIASTMTQVAKKVEEVEGQNVAGVTRLTDEHRISNIEQAVIKLGNTVDAVSTQFGALVDDYLAFKDIVKIKKDKPPVKIVKKKHTPSPPPTARPIPEPDNYEDEDDEDYDEEDELV